MQRPDEMRVSFEQNPAMQEFLRDKSPGTKAEAELHFTLKDMDGEGATLIVEAIVPEGFELADEDEAGEPGAVSPAGSDMMTPTAMLVRRKMGA